MSRQPNQGRTIRAAVASAAVAAAAAPASPDATTATAAAEAATDEPAELTPEEIAERRETAAAAFREAALKGEDPAAALGVSTVSREVNVERSAPTPPGSPSAYDATRAVEAASAAGRLMVAGDFDGDGLVDGLRVIVAFSDATTGNRVAPGDKIPDHIREDGPRLERLYDAGFITDRPAERRPLRSVEGGLKTETREAPNGEAQPIGSRRPAPVEDPDADAS